MPEFSTWVHDLQEEVHKLDPMLNILPNSELTLSLYERELPVDVAALAYYDRFLEDMRLTVRRLLAKLSTDDINARWRNK
jgi:hypothetical protein